MINLNSLAAEIYAQNKKVGWWDDPNRSLLTCLQLVNTEIAEATEGYRKNLQDPHLPHRKNEEVELADATIRLLDLAAHLGWEFEPKPLRAYAKYQKYRELPEAHLFLTRNICRISDYVSWLENIIWFEGEAQLHYQESVARILIIAAKEGYDLEGAIREKLEYNRHRSDHKRENRQKPGGKRI